MRRNGARLVAAVLLPAVLLLAAGMSAQPQRADPAITINDLACPSTTTTIATEVHPNLGQYQTPDTTYLLRPGVYDWSDVFATRSPGSVVCYLGTGTTSDQVTIQLSNTGFFQVAGDTLGFKGLVLTGTPEAAAIDVSNSRELPDLGPSQLKT